MTKVLEIELEGVDSSCFFRRLSIIFFEFGELCCMIDDSASTFFKPFILFFLARLDILPNEERMALL
jgi:hypothetical protein